MKRLICVLALLASSIPVADAQEAVPTPSVTDDLECAALVAFTLGAMADKATPEGYGLASGMTYFVGRAKGAQPDLDISEALSAEQVEQMAPRFDTIRERCAAEMRAMGTELQSIGK